MATETATTPLSPLQSFDTDIADAVTADLEVAICFLECCEDQITKVRDILRAFSIPVDLFRDIKNLDIMLGEAKEKVLLARENGGKTSDAIFAAKRAAKA